MRSSLTFDLKGTFVICMITLLTACNGGGGGGGDTADSGDTVAPAIALVSPTYKLATTNTGVEVEVRAEDNVAVSEVRINDIQAQQDDIPGLWTAVIPLTDTLSSIRVEASDAAGNETAESFNSQIRKVEEWDSTINDMSLGSDNQLVLTDSTNNDLLVLSLNTLNLESESLASATSEEVQLAAKPQTQSSISTNAILAVGQEIQSRREVNAILKINTNSGSTQVEVDLSGLGSNQVIDFVSETTGSETITHLLTTPQFARSGASIFEYVSSTDTLNEIVTLDPIFENPRELVKASSNLYVIDNDRVIQVTLSNQQTSVLSPAGQNGISLLQLSDISVDAARNLIWAINQSSNDLVQIDLSTGVRNIVSNLSRGSGPQFAKPDQVLAPDGEERIFVSDSMLNMVFAVDPESGDRQYLMSNRLGFGPRLTAPDSVSISPNSTHIAVADRDSAQIYEIEISSGNRRVVLDRENGFGVQGSTWQDNTRVWTIDPNTQSLVSIDLDSGLSTTLGTDLPPDLPSIEKPTDIFFSNTSNELVVSDIVRDIIYAIDTNTGQASAIARDQTSSNGTTISKPIAISEDATARKIYILDSLTKSVIEVDTENEQTRVVSGTSSGSGVNFSRPSGLAVSPARDRGYVSDTLSNQIIAFSLSTGNRAVVSGPTRGSGETIQSISALAYDTLRDQIIATDPARGAVYSIDPDNGDRALISR